MTAIMTLGSLPLGFNPVEVLLHMLNLAVLIIAIRLLLYKPIKKFMDKRAQGYLEVERENEQMKAETEEWKQNYAKLIENAKLEALEIEQENKHSASMHAAEIIDRAKKEAHDILDKAAQDTDRMKAQLKEEMSGSVSDLAVNIAAKVLEREISVRDNDEVIDSILQDWKGKQV